MFRNYKYTDKEQKELLKSIVVMVDKREQRNEHITQGLKSIGVSIVNRSLNFGDYSFMIPKNEQLGINRDIWFDKEIVIERKNSLEEISNNISQGRTQFENELIRAKNSKFILLIEDGSYKSILEGKYKTRISIKSFFSTIMTYQSRYNIQVTFTEKDVAYKYIYSTFYYYLRELIK